MTKQQKQADAMLAKAHALTHKACLLLSKSADTARPIEFGRISQAITEAREAINGDSIDAP